MTNQQFIVVGQGDDDVQAPLCLLTRRVFTSFEEADAFVKNPSPGRHRTGQVVQCYFTVPSSLYAGEWALKSEVPDAPALQDAFAVVEDQHNTTMALFRKRDDAKAYADKYSAEGADVGQGAVVVGMVVQ